MEKSTKEFLEVVMKKLTPHGPITARGMFGGYGIYFHKTMFASIVENVLYFRVDDSNRKDFAAYEAKPFIYDGHKKPVTMPYYAVPSEIFEDPKKLSQWIEKARIASLRAAQKKKSKVKN